MLRVVSSKNPVLGACERHFHRMQLLDNGGSLERGCSVGVGDGAGDGDSDGVGHRGEFFRSDELQGAGYSGMDIVRAAAVRDVLVLQVSRRVARGVLGGRARLHPTAYPIRYSREWEQVFLVSASDGRRRPRGGRKRRPRGILGALLVTSRAGPLFANGTMLVFVKGGSGRFPIAEG